MRQSADGLQVRLVFQCLNVAAGDHPAITDKDDLLNSIAALDLMLLVDHGGFILGIARIDFHPDRTTFGIADQSDDHLLATFLAVAGYRQRRPVCCLFRRFQNKRW